jgi:hypothetical protein
MSVFFTKAGWLTHYAMACGYIHKTELSPDRSIIFQRLECDAPVFNVTVYQRSATGAIDDDTKATLRDGIAFSKSGSIAECRRLYRQHVGTLRRRYEPASEVRRNVIA